MDEPDASKRFRPRWWARWWFVVSAIVCFIAVGGFALLLVPRWLVGEWYPSGATPTQLDKAIPQGAQIVLFALGGVIALIGVGVSLSRHGQELDGADRERTRAQLERDRHELERTKERQRLAEAEKDRKADHERALRARFVSAVELLADGDRALRRIAGIYAIAALADDWAVFGRQDERQVCIDVICGYLRAPAPEGIELTPPEEVEVRRTAFSVIVEHLSEGSDGAPPFWSGATISLRRARIDYDLTLDGLQLGKGTRFDLTEVTVNRAEVVFRELNVAGGTLILERARVNDGEIVFGGGSVSGEGEIDCSGAVIGKNGSLRFASPALSEGGSLCFWLTSVREGGKLIIYRANFDAAHLQFQEVDVLSGNVAVSGVARGSVVDISRLNVAGSGRVDFGSLLVWPNGVAKTDDLIVETMATYVPFKVSESRESSGGSGP